MQAPTTRPSPVDDIGHVKPFRTAAVLGAGTMGAQIAAHLANAGLDVLLLDLPAREGDDRNAVVRRGFQQARKAKPDPFFSEAAARRVRLGNLEDDFERLADVDWVIEAVVERLDVKRSLLERLEGVVREDAIVSTNTSGIPVGEIAEGRSASLRRRFLGTHFFNPPRYLELLELVPSADTDPAVLGRVARFARLHLGKGVVVAKDTPYFIGNRIGVYGMMRAIEAWARGDYTVEEIDALTGPVAGRPRSATFRTADLVGLDVMKHVADNLYEAVPDDEGRDAFQAPDVLVRLVEQGALGEKTKAGFYKKEGKEIRSFDPEKGAYTSPEPLDLGDLDAIRKTGDLPERLNALFEDGGRTGAFFRSTTLDLLGYSARRLPEIADSPADVDRAIRWGFGWERGPFEIWDALGMERVVSGMEEAGVALPGWVEEMRLKGADTFYREVDGRRQVYRPDTAEYADDPVPADEVRLAAVRTRPERTLWRNAEAELLDLGDGVALYAFRSKANTLGAKVMRGLMEVIGKVEDDPDLRGLVVGNEGNNFSVGANLGELAHAVQERQYELIGRFVDRFQEAVQRVRYARKPIVVAVHQRVLGGACELVMASPHPAAAAESYIGLVELGVGLIPAGTGTMRLAAQASMRAPNGHPSEILPWIQRYFEQVAMAKVATSAEEAREMGYLPESATVVMHQDRRLYVAKEIVLRLSNAGFRAPSPAPIKVLGRPGGAALDVAVQQYLEGGFISEYDAHLARRLGHVLTGGALTAPQEVDEDYLLGLEREVFLGLVGEKKTQERVVHVLEHNKPLRN